MNAETIERIRARLVRATTTLEDTLDTNLVDGDGMDIIRSIIKFLIKTDLGREATSDEIIAVCDRMQERFDTDNNTGAEPG